MPQISVLMPVYKPHPDYLRAAIESILAQDFTDFEYLILNDCPTDKASEEIILSYQDKRIIYDVSVKNQGISGARNQLLDKAQGDYIAIMDHDDISLPNRFSRQVDFLQSHPEIGIVGSYAQDIVSGKHIFYPVQHDDIQKNLFVKCCILHPTAMIRRNLFVDYKIRYREIYTPAEDYALWVDMLGKTQFHNIPEVLFHYRQHSENTSHTKAVQMRKTTFGVQQLAKTQSADLWNNLQADMMHIQRIYCFGLLICTIKQDFAKKSYFLFGKIPFLTIKSKSVIV